MAAGVFLSGCEFVAVRVGAEIPGGVAPTSTPSRRIASTTVASTRVASTITTGTVLIR